MFKFCFSPQACLLVLEYAPMLIQPGSVEILIDETTYTNIIGNEVGRGKVEGFATGLDNCLFFQNTIPFEAVQADRTEGETYDIVSLFYAMAALRGTVTGLPSHLVVYTFTFDQFMDDLMNDAVVVNGKQYTVGFRRRVGHLLLHLVCNPEAVLERGKRLLSESVHGAALKRRRLELGLPAQDIVTPEALDEDIPDWRELKDFATPPMLRPYKQC